MQSIATSDRDRIWNVLEDLLVTIDAEGKYISVNPAWTTVLGWSETELLGHNPEWLIHPDDRKKTVNELNRLAAGQRTLRFENRLRHKNGSHSLFSWVAVRDQDLIYAAARDITEIKRSEDALRFSIREIGKADRHTTMSEMTASIAHEINQPLSAIITNSQAGLRWLARADPDLDEVRKVLNRIADDGRRAGEVISSIRAMFGEGRREKHSVKVNDLICDVLALIHAELERQHVALQMELSDGVSEIIADRVQLQQVLLNLFNNALEAMSSVTGRPHLLSVKSQTLEPGAYRSWWKTAAPALTRRTWTASSTHSSRPKPVVWAWDCRFAVQSSKRTAVDFGQPPERRMEQSFTSHCR